MLKRVTFAAALLVSLPLAAQEAEAPAATEATPAPQPPAAPTPTPDPLLAELQPIMVAFGKLFDERRFVEAGKELEAAEKIAPEHPVVLGARAGIYAETGEIEKARQIYETILTKEPNAFIPKYNLAELFLLRKDYVKGLEAFEALLKEFPESDLIRYKIILIHLHEKRQQQALEALKALERPGNPTPFMFYGAAAVAIANADLMTGKRMILAAEQTFGAGRQKLLYDSLAEIGLVMRGDYPPKPEEGQSAPPAAPQP